MLLFWLPIACIEPAVQATIVPANPSTEDTLRIQLSGDAADILSVRWIKNEVVFGQGKFLGPIFTARDEIWSAEVSVMSDKPFNITAPSVTVSNTPPVLTSITLSPVAPIAGDGLLCEASAVDVDFDELEISFRWDGPDGFIRNDKVEPDRLTAGLWICTATASDGDLESTSLTESIFVDENLDSIEDDESSTGEGDMGEGDTAEQ